MNTRGGRERPPPTNVLLLHSRAWVVGPAKPAFRRFGLAFPCGRSYAAGMGRRALVLAVVVISAGCGTGSGTSSSTTEDVPTGPSTPPASSEPAAQSFPTLRAAVA